MQVIVLVRLQRGTVVEKLTEVTLKDWNHLKELLSVCEGKRLRLLYCQYFQQVDMI